MLGSVIFIFSVFGFYVATGLLYMTMAGKFKTVPWVVGNKNILYLGIGVLWLWILWLQILSLGGERGIAAFIFMFSVMGPVTIILENRLGVIWLKTVKALALATVILGAIITMAMVAS